MLGDESPYLSEGNSTLSEGNSTMWRSIFIALGIMAIVVGVECLLIDSATFYTAAETRASTFLNPMNTPSVNIRQWQPKEWFPWVTVSAGAITILYVFTLPKRFNRAAA